MSGLDEGYPLESIGSNQKVNRKCRGTAIANGWENNLFVRQLDWSVNILDHDLKNILNNPENAITKILICAGHNGLATLSEHLRMRVWSRTQSNPFTNTD